MRYLVLCMALWFASSVQAADLVTEVEAAMETLNDAFPAHDVAKIKSLMTPDHLAVTPYAGVQTVGEQIQTIRDLKYDEYAAGKMSAKTVGDSCVLVTYPLKLKGSFKGKQLPPETMVLGVWVKKDGKWLELHYQETIMLAP